MNSEHSTVSSVRRGREVFCVESVNYSAVKMREIVHLQAGQCGNQIGAKVITRC